MYRSKPNRIKAGGVATGGLESYRAGVFLIKRESSVVPYSVDDLCTPTMSDEKGQTIRGILW